MIKLVLHGTYTSQTKIPQCSKDCSKQCQIYYLILYTMEFQLAKDYSFFQRSHKNKTQVMLTRAWHQIRPKFSSCLNKIRIMWPPYMIRLLSMHFPWWHLIIEGINRLWLSMFYSIYKQKIHVISIDSYLELVFSLMTSF